VLQAHKPTPPTDTELEAMADALAASGQYRIQRRLRPRPRVDVPAGTELKQALFVDVETTGLDHRTDEIIELAMVSFTYGPNGRIYDVKEPFQRFNQPSKPISAEITKLTGITDEMVAGHTLNPAEVEAFAQDAVLVIAHNAGFDRRFMECLAPGFALKGWACSQSQIDWAGEGIEGTRLSYLVAGAGFFYDKHRAVNDCLAAIELLAATADRPRYRTECATRKRSQANLADLGREFALRLERRFKSQGLSLESRRYAVSKGMVY
jgi:DNA polymerase-3 subunit epsilon